MCVERMCIEDHSYPDIVSRYRHHEQNTHRRNGECPIGYRLLHSSLPIPYPTFILGSLRERNLR